jgi:hypothetical protein
MLSSNTFKCSLHVVQDIVYLIPEHLVVTFLNYPDDMKEVMFEDFKVDNLEKTHILLIKSIEEKKIKPK